MKVPKVKATVTYTGQLVDKPETVYMYMDPKDDALEQRQADGTTKIRKVGELMDNLLEEYFTKKYLEGSPYEQRVISINYERVMVDENELV